MDVVGIIFHQGRPRKQSDGKWTVEMADHECINRGFECGR